MNYLAKKTSMTLLSIATLLASCAKNNDLNFDSKGNPLVKVDTTPKTTRTTVQATDQSFGTATATDTNPIFYSYKQVNASADTKFALETNPADSLTTKIEVFSKNGITVAAIANAQSQGGISGNAGIDSTRITITNLKTNKTGITLVLPAPITTVTMKNEAFYTGAAISAATRQQNLRAETAAMAAAQWKIQP